MILFSLMGSALDNNYSSCESKKVFCLLGRLLKIFHTILVPGSCFKKYTTFCILSDISNGEFLGGHPSKPKASKRIIVVMHSRSKPNCLF